MKIMVSNPMRQLINANSNGMFTARLETLTLNEYCRYVDYDVFQHEIDYSPKTGKFKVLKIVYPAAYFANNKYITTKDLSKIYHHSGANTINEYITAVITEISI